MKIAIVEDNDSNRLTLHRHISDYAQEYQLSLTIDSYLDGIDFIKSAVANYDIIYLDIEMTTMDGLTTAKQIRKKMKALSLYLSRIFLTMLWKAIELMPVIFYLSL